MTSKRVVGIVLTSAVVAGYAGAAAWSAWAAPHIEVATGFGEGDGLTRYALTAQTGAAGAGLLAALEAVPGVASAQSLDGDRALVAVDGVSPDRLRAVPGVAAVELSPSLPVLGTLTDPYARDYGWNLENTGSNAYQQTATVDADMDATAGWDIGTGAGRVVAVVDTGFDSDHVEFAGSLWTNPDQPCGAPDTDGNGLAGDCHGWNYYANDADVDNGTYGSHGTSVAGVVGARAGNGAGTAGVAPGVTLMPLVIGGGQAVDVNLGAKAIRYAVDNGADVITASWGGAFGGQPLQNLKDAVAYAAAHDVLIVAAAGNDTANRDTSTMYPASLPDANIITVGSSTATDTASASSAYGAANVDLFAPGNKVATTWNDGGMRLVSGTSIAAPHVAAAVALYRAAMPAATAAEIKAALLADVDPVPAFAGRSVTGGRLTMSRLGDQSAEPVQYAFTSMTARPGIVRPTIGISTPAAGGSYSVDVGLGMEHEGTIWALSEEAVTLDGVQVLTDDSGDARFDLGTIEDFDGIGLSPAVDLAAGRYVLTVQLYRDGEPLGRMHAAPLLVSSVASPSAPAPGGTPGTPAPGGTTPPGSTPAPGSTPEGTAPGTTSPSTPRPGAPVPDVSPPGGTTPGTPAPTGPQPGVAPGTPAPGTPAPGTTAPGPGTPAPGAPAPDGTAPDGTAPDSPAPSAPAPGAPVPGGTAPDSPAPSAPAPGAPAPSGPAPTAPGTTPGTTTYPEVGDFRITSLSPNEVVTAGGTLVTITGLALPADPVVRIGATATASVVSSSGTRLAVRVPARVAGSYDVTVVARDGRSVVLPAALTYAESVGTAPAPRPGTTAPGTPSPGTPSPGTPSPGTPSPGTPSPGTPSPGTPAPSGDPTVRSGLSGERLVRSDRFAALGGIWSVSCSASCTGVAL